MTGNPNTQETTTVVIEEKKNRKAALLWVAAGTACVLAGGATLALWSDSSVFTGGKIAAGDLDLVSNSTAAYYDVSKIDGTPNGGAGGLDTVASDLRGDEITAIPNTTGLGHSIDLGTFSVVPGDTVAAVYDATVKLKGDNLVADLTVAGLGTSAAAASDASVTHDSSSDTDGVSDGDSPTSTGTSGDAADSEVSGGALTGSNGFTDHSSSGDINYGYALYKDGVLLDSGAVPTSGTIATFASPEGPSAADDDNDGTGTGPTDVITLASGSTDITVVITANFNKDVEHRQDVGAAETLQDVTLSLVQTRTAGAQNSAS